MRAMTRGVALLLGGALAAGCVHHPRYRFPAAFAPPVGFVEEGVASWYGPGYHGNRTSSGEVYDQEALTAAHATFVFGTRVRVTLLSTRRSVVVRINDRGPFSADRIIDLSYAAAYKLGYVTAGSAKVEVEAILPGKV